MASPTQRVAVRDPVRGAHGFHASDCGVSADNLGGWVSSVSGFVSKQAALGCMCYGGRCGPYVDSRASAGATIRLREDSIKEGPYPASLFRGRVAAFVGLYAGGILGLHSHSVLRVRTCPTEVPLVALAVSVTVVGPSTTVTSLDFRARNVSEGRLFGVVWQLATCGRACEDRSPASGAHGVAAGGEAHGANGPVSVYARRVLVHAFLAQDHLATCRASRGHAGAPTTHGTVDTASITYFW